MTLKGDPPQAFCFCKLKIGEGCCILSGVDTLWGEKEVDCWLNASLDDVAEPEAFRFCEAGVLFADPVEGPADGLSPLQDHSQRSKRAQTEAAPKYRLRM